MDRFQILNSVVGRKRHRFRCHGVCSGERRSSPSQENRGLRLNASIIKLPTMNFRAGDAVELSGTAVSDSWSAADQNLWATDDDYSSFNLASKFSSGNAATDSSASKKSKTSQKSSKLMGKMFFKTKLCGKFRVGVCPYITNCNFAHGMEELRRPPPNWQDIVATQHNYDEAEPLASSPPRREEHQIPILSLSEMRGSESQRTYKGRHCKKFYTEEGCLYGDSCTFLHDEQSRSRESVAISLSPTVGGGGYGSSGANGLNQKPSNWKTRICNKWETTGSCPFGNKCNFAHGVAGNDLFSASVLVRMNMEFLCRRAMMPQLCMKI